MAATGTQELENGAEGESARGYAMLGATGLWPPPREVAYLHSARFTVADRAFQDAISDVVRRLASLQVEVSDPRQAHRFVSRDRHTALVVAALEGALPFEVRRAILSTAAAHPGLTIEETGDISASNARDRQASNDLR